MMKDKSQASKFKEAARELECDEGEKQFEATVKKLAKASKPAKGSKDGK